MAFIVPCFHPLKALRSSSGVKVLPGTAQIYNLTLPCGRCIGCRLERSRQWALRCIHEASLHEHNCFVTLTYSDENQPDDEGLHFRDVQLFLKRLRKRFPGVRYYGCGEYGGQFGRPHWHIILFNLTFNDLTLWKRSNADHSLYRSATLEALWPYGYSSIGRVTFESAAYVARYIMKKVTGDPANRAYQVVSIVTGEVINRRPEFNFMSLKPGIAAKWWAKYHNDVTSRDSVIHDGTPSKPPRYYDKLLKAADPELFANIHSKRILDMQSKLSDNTPQRLQQKEIVTNAKLSKLKRGLS